MVKSEHSAKLRIEWGIVCLSAKINEVDKAIYTVYHASLGRLRINPKMRKEFRMMPGMYQGLRMFNLNIDGLGARIFFLHQHWNMNTPMSKMRGQAFEAFQMNVGLKGNIFVWTSIVCVTLRKTVGSRRRGNCAIDSKLHLSFTSPMISQRRDDETRC